MTTQVVIVVAMIALSFISSKLLELKIHVVSAKKEGEIFLWMTAQVVIVVAMITSSFITSKSLELEIYDVNAKKEGNRIGSEYLKIFMHHVDFFCLYKLLLFL